MRPLHNPLRRLDVFCVRNAFHCPDPFILQRRFYFFTRIPVYFINSPPTGYAILSKSPAQRYILVKAEKSDSPSREQNFHPPTFYVLLNHLVNHGFTEPQLFQINGDPDEVRAIIDTLDGEAVVGNVGFINIGFTYSYLTLFV